MISASAHDQYVLLSVEDRGSGVPNAALEKIFNPFERLNTARPDGQGFGLGLAIARRMVELMGGRIYAQNLPNGFRVCFELKVYKL